MVQQECGVHIGETYPRPVVDFEAQRERFWSRYEKRRPEAARELCCPEIAKRASFSGRYNAARAIADEHGEIEDNRSDGTQLSFGDITEMDASVGSDDRSESGSVKRDTVEAADPRPVNQSDTERQTTIPSGTGRNAGEPSPDDHAAASNQQRDCGGDDDAGDKKAQDIGQTRVRDFG